MHLYVIVAPPDSSLSDDTMKRVFDQCESIIPGKAWAVGTEVSTCADVRDLLRGDEPVSCVVVKANEYNGYTKRSLWEKMASWERS